MPTMTNDISMKATWKDFYTPNFSAVHLPLDDISNEFLIFGNLPIPTPADDLSPGLGNFLGRWEGIEIGPYGDAGTHIILVITRITPQDGFAYLWAGVDLQYPFYIKEIHFRVVSEKPQRIEWQGDLTGPPEGKGVQGGITFTYDEENQQLIGSVHLPPSDEVVRTILLSHAEAGHYFRDYAGYLGRHGITFHTYKDASLRRFGHGYAIYTPEEYTTDPQTPCPLLIFLIGTGERGQSLSLLTKHGPLHTVLQGKSLPFIIASPMLEVSPDFRSFPETYLDGLMNEILTDFRVDPKRSYLTGLSMGGEATYRYALHRPELFAALAPLAAFDPVYLPNSIQDGFRPFTLPWERIADVPVWAVHGSEDPVVPLSAAQRTVNALIAAGGYVRFTVVDGDGHNIWTDIYTNQELYNWLLKHHRS